MFGFFFVFFFGGGGGDYIMLQNISGDLCLPVISYFPFSLYSGLLPGQTKNLKNLSGYHNSVKAAYAILYLLGLLDLVTHLLQIKIFWNLQSAQFPELRLLMKQFWLWISEFQKIKCDAYSTFNLWQWIFASKSFPTRTFPQNYLRFYSVGRKEKSTADKKKSNFLQRIWMVVETFSWHVM